MVPESLTFNPAAKITIMAISSKHTDVRETNPLRRTLADVRHGLLGLHKALIVAEQLTYERIYGRVDSTGQLLQLVMNDPWFTWLHPLSNMVVRIDELLDGHDQRRLMTSRSY